MTIANAETFLEEVTDFIGRDYAEILREGVEEVDIEADYHPHAARLRVAISYVLGRSDKTIHERITALDVVCKNRGTITLPRDLGWEVK